MKNPLVVIIIPVFNGAAYIAQTIEAIFAQDYSNFKLIILDDGSTDDTKLIVESFLFDNRLTIISESVNSGIVCMRNKGLYLAESEYFAFVDSDDVVAPSWLSEQVLYLNKNPDVAVVGCWIESVDLNLNPIDDGVWHSLELAGENACYLLKGSPLSMSATLFRRSMISGVNFLDQYPAAEDYAYWVDLIMLRRCRLANVQKVLLKYRRHSEQTSTEKRGLQIQSHLLVFEKIFMEIGLDFERKDILRHAALIELFDEGVEEFDLNFLIWAMSWIENILKRSEDDIFPKKELVKFFVKYWRKACRKSIKNIGLWKAVFMFVRGCFRIAIVRNKTLGIRS